MKKSILIYLVSFMPLFCSWSDSSAQTSIYHPFPDSNAVWTIFGQGCCVNSCAPPPSPNPVLSDHNLSYYIQGDTSINNVDYHKVYYSGSVYHHCSIGTSVSLWQQLNETYMGAIRQDTALKLVYLLGTGLVQECLMYDFDLSVGDTLNYGCMLNGGLCAVVTSVDSVLIGTSYRKRFNLSTSPPYSIIEGVGSTAGLYEPLCPFEYIANLVCFSQNGQTLYPDTVTGCDILASVEQPFVPEQSNKIYPNPFTEKAFLNNGDAFIGSDLIIYNSLGAVMYVVRMKEESTLIERNDLPGGVYFYQCINPKGIMLSGKFIIK